MDVNEIDLLETCALRIDGYAWAVDHGVEREELMKPFWHPELRESLFRASWDYQWAAWFMQQRAFRWSSSAPTDDAVALWRQLFLGLARKRPSPPFDRGGPDGDGTARRRWERLYAPRVAALEAAIAERLRSGLPAEGSFTVD